MKNAGLKILAAGSAIGLAYVFLMPKKDETAPPDTTGSGTGTNTGSGTNTNTNTNTPVDPERARVMKTLWNNLTVTEKQKYGMEWLLLYCRGYRKIAHEVVYKNKVYKIQDTDRQKGLLIHASNYIKDLNKKFSDLQIAYYNKYGTNLISDWSVDFAAFPMPKETANTHYVKALSYTSWLNSLKNNTAFQGLGLVY